MCTFSISVYVLCRRGNDSQIVVRKLKQHFKDSEIKDIKGGLHAWAREIDENFPVYWNKLLHCCLAFRSIFVTILILKQLLDFGKIESMTISFLHVSKAICHKQNALLLWKEIKISFWVERSIYHHKPLETGNFYGSIHLELFLQCCMQKAYPRLHNNEVKRSRK